MLGPFLLTALCLLVWHGVRLYIRQAQHDPPLVVLAGDAFYPKVDGVATFSRNTIHHLTSTFRVHVFCSIPGPQKLFGAQVTRFWYFTVPHYPNHYCTLPTLSVFLELIRLRPQVVHLFEFGLFTMGMLVYCKILGIPVSMSHHTRLDLYSQHIAPRLPVHYSLWILSLCERYLYPLVDAHLAVCTNLVDRLHRYVNPDTIHRWSSGVDSVFSPIHRDPSMRTRLCGGVDGSTRKILLHVGRLSPEKDSSELLPIIHALRDTGLHVAIVGDGPMRADLEAATRSESHVTFLGFLHGSDLHAAFASADIFLSPSTTETFPLVYLEAMKSGIPVVGPRAGGVPDTFEDTTHGRLYPPGDSAACATAVQYVLDHYPQMCMTLQTHVEQYTWDRSMLHLQHILQTLCRRT
jgi:glycosyltransferase involved in cell wall biosynthesis